MLRQNLLKNFTQVSVLLTSILKYLTFLQKSHNFYIGRHLRKYKVNGNASSNKFVVLPIKHSQAIFYQMATVISLKKLASMLYQFSDCDSVNTSSKLMPNARRLLSFIITFSFLVVIIFHNDDNNIIMMSKPSMKVRWLTVKVKSNKFIFDLFAPETDYSLNKMKCWFTNH